MKNTHISIKYEWQGFTFAGSEGQAVQSYAVSVRRAAKHLSGYLDAGVFKVRYFQTRACSLQLTVVISVCATLKAHLLTT